MSIILLQSAGILILASMLLWIHKKKELKNSEAILIKLVIISLMIIIAIPEKISELLFSAGFIRPLDAFLSITSITALFIGVKIYLKQVEVNRNITKIVQHVGIKESSRKGSRNNA